MFVGVIISISHENVDKVYHYSIPDGMELDIGMRVYVPFGKGNRRIEAYVVEFKDSVDIPLDKLKPVMQIAEGYSIISPDRIKLAVWMRSKYYTTLSSCMQCIIPKRVDEKLFKVARLKTDCRAEELINKLPRTAKKQAAILRLLQGGEEIPVSHIKNFLGTDMSAINALVKKGAVEINDVREYRGCFPIGTVRSDIPPKLTDEQAAAVERIYEAIDSRDIKPIMLRGVTGSGKTEIYLRSIDKVLAMGKQAIVLVPEISLTQQTVERFVARFGSRVAVTHSKLSAGERYDQWTRARRGEIDIMIGPRSAVFTPFERLGIVIIDEEHENTYKSESSPKYDTREVAYRLGKLYNSVTLLGSATPSVTSYYKAKNGDYTLIELNNRVNKSFPDICITDMRDELNEGNRSIFGASLQAAIERNLEDGKQTIIFLNRRGFSTFVSCRNCGYVLKCKHCDVNYTYHHGSNRLMCHYCGRVIDVPRVCPVCGSKHIRYFGIGTERVEEELKKLFPSARTLRMDRDTTAKKNGHQLILDKFRNGEADILIGTQMIAKGLDFPKVTLVGVIAADLSLNMGDYHSAETTFQLLCQVAGRAGRAEDKGLVFIQTYNPKHYSIVYAADNDYLSFYNQEIIYRRELNYPPFTNIFSILFECEDERLVIQRLNDLLYIMLHYNKDNQFEHLGPVPAVISKINNKYRWRITVKGEDEAKLKNYVLYCLNKLKQWKGTNNININIGLNSGYSL